MNVPDWVEGVLSSFEDRTTSFHEAEIADALRSARKAQGDQSDADWKGFGAEWAAFLFRVRRNQDSVWNTYFAPMMSAKNADDTDFFSPDIKALDAEVFAYWKDRARSCRNPIMRARYSDLVWDLEFVTTCHKPSHRYAQTAIVSYLEAVEKKLYPMDVVGIEWLQRALDLSRSINDSDRTSRIVAFMFEFYDTIAKPQFMGTWLFLFDDLYGKKFVSSEQESRIIVNLEEMLAKVSDTTATNEGVHPTLDPWGAEAAAERLAQHYRRMKDQRSVNRVVMLYGKAFEHIAGKANPMMAMSWLQPVIEKYEQEGLKADAERLQIMSSEKGKDIDADLKRISVNIEATQEDVEKMVDTLIGSGDLTTSLGRIAVYFIPKTSDARELLEKLKTTAPLLSMIPIAIIEKDGHSSATIGSLEDDPDGRLHQQLAQLLQFFQPFLTHTLAKLRERYAPTVENILDFLCLSPLFAQSQNELLRDGLLAYDQEDFVKAIHVLIPQIEHILRTFLGSMSIPMLRTVRNHSGIQDAKSMNEVLGDERMRKVLTEDLWRYLEVFYVDKRGLNLRNDLAHGLVPPGGFKRHIADRVFHTLLALSLMRAAKS